MSEDIKTPGQGVVKRLAGLRIQIGGEEPTGWLPPGAATPLPTPTREVLIDVEIDFDGNGYLLCCQSRDGSLAWDTWNESLDDAERAAVESLGIQPSQWSKDSSAAAP